MGAARQTDAVLLRCDSLLLCCHVMMVLNSL
jgi:hypothetical protein